MRSPLNRQSVGVGMFKEFFVALVVVILRLLASIIEKTFNRTTPQEREEIFYDQTRDTEHD